MPINAQWKNIPVNVQLEMDSLQVPVTDVLNFAPGRQIALTHHRGDLLTIRIDQAVAGHGLPVLYDNNRLAVHIKQWLRPRAVGPTLDTTHPQGKGGQ